MPEAFEPGPKLEKKYEKCVQRLDKRVNKN